MKQRNPPPARRPDAAAPAPELTIVIPVYDEEATIGRVVDEWSAEAGRLGIDYRLVVYDDGSRDATPRVLATLAARHERLEVKRHANRGHGPTILRGYREARGEWVLQVDGDGEMPASAFESLWSGRDAYDVVLGYRDEREAAAARRVVTAVARGSVRALFGTALRDVNTPYRLMRRERLDTLVAELPDDTFAPNVILSGLAARRGLRIAERPVRHVGRAAGATSLVRWSLWRAALRAFRQTFAAARREARR